MKYFAMLAFVIILSGCNPVANPSIGNQTVSVDPTPAPTIEQLPEVVDSSIPNESWEPIFFEAIDEVTDEIGFERLRDRHIGNGDIEVRIWYGFGLFALEGFVLKRKANQWNALRISNGTPVRSRGYKTIPFTEPKSGWNSLWSSLRHRNILTLPDARRINCGGNSIDGFSYVVEIKKGNSYRTYMYDNPMYRKEPCAQAHDIMAIGKLIDEEFGSAIFRHEGNR